MQVRGLLHIHSTYSDGEVALLSLRKFFLEKGFQFVVMAEHIEGLSMAGAERFIKECHELSDERLIIIPGFEVQYGEAHILAIGVDRFIEVKFSEDAIFQYAKEALAVLAHPHRNKFKISKTLENIIHGIEIWNSQYDGKYAPRPKSMNLLKGIRRQNKNFFAYAGLDFHRFSHFGGPALILEVDSLNQKQVLESLRQGKFVIQRGGIKIGSDGEFSGGNKRYFRIISAISTLLIDIFKFTNKLLAKMGVSLPRKVKAIVRSKL